MNVMQAFGLPMTYLRQWWATLSRVPLKNAADIAVIVEATAVAIGLIYAVLQFSIANETKTAEQNKATATFLEKQDTSPDLHEALLLVRRTYPNLSIDNSGYDRHEEFKKSDREYFYTLYTYFNNIATCIEAHVCNRSYARSLFCADVVYFIEVFRSYPDEPQKVDGWDKRSETISQRFISFVESCPGVSRTTKGFAFSSPRSTEDDFWLFERKR